MLPIRSLLAGKSPLGVRRKAGNEDISQTQIPAKPSLFYSNLVNKVSRDLHAEIPQHIDIDKQFTPIYSY